VVAAEPINWTSANITVNTSVPYALDKVFNGTVNTNDLSSFGSGTYRVYAAFRDPDGNILIDDREVEMVTWCKFYITFE
jgi:hypothetical protein